MKTKGNLVSLISVIFILLAYGVPVYAAMTADTAIADKISSSIKTEITANTLKQEKEDIINKVKTELKSLNIDETLITKIINSLNDNDSLTTDKVDVIAAIIKTTITNMLKQSTGIDKKFENINERIENLEAAKQPKMLSPYKDVDFLFEDVIGDAYDAADKENLIVDNKKIKKIEITTHYFKGDEVLLTFDDNKMTEVDNKDLVPMVIEAKMQAVEKTLGITPSEPGADLVKRIGRAYEKINNKDWQNDDLRFGVLTSYLPDAYAVATSVALHGYLGYRRFTPGFTLNNWSNLSNLGRRLSLFFAVGTASAMDNSGGKSAEIKSPVLSAGIGFDIVKGFVLSAGLSVFSYKAPADQDYNAKSSLTVGITLNSDLWRMLFNNK